MSLRDRKVSREQVQSNTPVDFSAKGDEGCTMSFASRQDAGQRLGQHLLNEEVQVDVVVGLPRGGVVVAAEVAHVLHVPLDVLVVRKIGHPLQREFAVGALAENDVVLLDEHEMGSDETTRAMVSEVIREERERLLQYQRAFHEAQATDFCDKAVLIVDDGLATGRTMEAAVMAARRRGAKEVLVGVPVASTTAIGNLERVTNGVFALICDPGFEAVGAYYESFSQTSDDEVIQLLRAEHAQH
jgi:putative phosphoribosyl transferase